MLADIFFDLSTVVDVDFRINYHQIIIEINRFIRILRDKISGTAADKVGFDFHNGIVVNENTNGIVTVNGQSYEGAEKQTENTNFALLVAKQFSEPIKDSNG